MKRRGVGYCMNRGCAGYTRGYALLEIPKRFECPTCLRPGRIERERGVRSGRWNVVTEVRIEFDYDPVRGVYRDSARVRDARQGRVHGVYTLQSPLIASRTHAVHVGRVALRALNRLLPKPPMMRRIETRDELAAQGWQTLI